MWVCICIATCSACCSCLTMWDSLCLAFWVLSPLLSASPETCGVARIQRQPSHGCPGGAFCMPRQRLQCTSAHPGCGIQRHAQPFELLPAHHRLLHYPGTFRWVDARLVGVGGMFFKLRCNVLVLCPCAPGQIVQHMPNQVIPGNSGAGARGVVLLSLRWSLPALLLSLKPAPVRCFCPTSLCFHLATQ